MHIDENRIGIAAGGHFAQIESDGVERIVDAAMFAEIFQPTMLA
jgi:hypothetical protein